MSSPGAGMMEPSPLDDIEDMVLPEGAGVVHYREPAVFPKTCTVKKRGVIRKRTDVPSLHLPGSQFLWVKTFGCSHNVSDSEYMQGMLGSYGYQFVENKDEADAWVIVSCTVKNPSQDAFVNLVKKAKLDKKALVVAGCVPQADRNLPELEGVSILGVQQIDRVVEVVEQTLQGNIVRMLAKSDLPRLDLPKIRRNPLVEIVPLSTGCLGSCTYCKTRHARGKLGSYSPDVIVKRARDVVEEGVTEIWLSSEDTGAYGRDLGTSLSFLIDSLVPVLPPNVMLRLGMTNPPFILHQLEAIARALRHPNVFAFLHIPVQAGSDSVLHAMNREYTREEFCKVADYLLEKVPGLTLATDIICGFPTETEEDFLETLELLKKYRMAITNISQFYPRPGTPAAKLKRLPTAVVKERSRRVTKLFESFNPYQGMEGQVHKVWFNTETSDDKTQSVGHTKGYIKVLVPYDKQLIGSVAQVCITEVARWHVVGEVLTHRKIMGSVTMEDEESNNHISGQVILQHHLVKNEPKAKSCVISPTSCSMARSGMCHCMSSSGGTSPKLTPQAGSPSSSSSVTTPPLPAGGVPSPPSYAQYTPVTTLKNGDEGNHEDLVEAAINSGPTVSLSFYVLLVVLASLFAWVLRISDGIFF